MSKYWDLKVLFFAEALKSAASQSKFSFKNKLRYLMNQFTSLYNKEITNTMLQAYSADSETFDKVSDVMEQIGEEFSKVDILDYYLLLQVLKEFNKEKNG